MRIIAIGDKSRYQFFRNMVNNKNDSVGNFFTEKLGDKDIYMTSDEIKVSEDTYYSNKIPLNTVIIFPNEYNDMSFNSGVGDKIIVFDEFPYASGSEVENIKKLILSGVKSQIEVILVKNGREYLKSDISTEESAIVEAKSYYEKMEIKTYVYDSKEKPYFLMCICEKVEKQLEKVIWSNIENVKKQLGIFDGIYDFSLEISEIPILTEVNVLASFFEYDESIKTRNIWKIYRRRVLDFYWNKNKKKIVKFYSEIYRDALKDVCVWDLSKDVDELTKIIQKEFRRNLNGFTSLSFYGEKEYYEEFLNEHKEEVIKFKNEIKNFFEIKLKDILKNRIEHKIKKMEELIEW